MWGHPPNHKITSLQFHTCNLVTGVNRSVNICYAEYVIYQPVEGPDPQVENHFSRHCCEYLVRASYPPAHPGEDWKPQDAPGHSVAQPLSIPPAHTGLGPHRLGPVLTSHLFCSWLVQVQPLPLTLPTSWYP